jgi:hypothetical protein
MTIMTSVRLKAASREQPRRGVGQQWWRSVMVERAKSGTGEQGRTVFCEQVPVRAVLHNHEN